MYKVVYNTSFDNCIALHIAIFDFFKNMYLMALTRNPLFHVILHPPIFRQPPPT